MHELFQAIFNSFYALIICQILSKYYYVLIYVIIPFHLELGSLRSHHYTFHNDTLHYRQLKDFIPSFLHTRLLLPFFGSYALEAYILAWERRRKKF